jgi:carbon-monoxide dehydrogenase large subunit
MSVAHGPTPPRPAPPGRWIGHPLRRLEDGRYLRGQARYIADLALPGMVHMVVVRSPYAHARLEAISLDRAWRAPGVLAVVTGRDLEGRVQPLPVEAREGAQIARAARHPLLATDRVRYVGQPVAAVVAETGAAALEAALLVELSCEPLPPVTDPHDALRGGVRLHDAVDDNGLLRWSRSGGEVAAAFQSARRVVRGQFHLPRLAAAPIETRGALAAYDPGTDVVTLWLSAQDPHRPRAQLSHVLGRPEDRIRVIVPDVGGAFGSKGALAPESALAAVIAMDLGRPVRWIEDRRENLAASSQGRGLDAEVEMAVRDDGRILGVRARLVADLGAYLLPSTAIPAITTGMLLTGAYDIPAASVELVGAATNKVPLGPYRGAGRPEAAFVVERMVDLIARELGLDPVEVRRRNLIPPERFPYARVHVRLGQLRPGAGPGAAAPRVRPLARGAAARQGPGPADRGRLRGLRRTRRQRPVGERCRPGGSRRPRRRPPGVDVTRTGARDHVRPDRCRRLGSRSA